MGMGRGTALAAMPEALPPKMEAPRPEFAELFAVNLRFVWRVVKAHGVREADVEDATQEVFLVAHRRFGDWDAARASARTWLYAIAARVAANYRRSSYVRHEAPGDAAPVEGTLSSRDPSETVDQRRALERLYAALADLDADKRQVFVLFELEELSMKEVAEIAECPLQTAYTRLHAARRLLADVLGEGNKP
jgi:RNA polymerase sigma-70 factor, ECF subfamily